MSFPAVLILLVDLLDPLHVLLVDEVIDLGVVVRADVVRLHQHQIFI